MIKFLLMGIIVMTAITGLAKAEGTYLRDLTMDYKTSHLDWAGSPVGGAIKTLFIVSRSGSREVIEVAQRMKLDFKAVTVFSANKFTLESIYENSVAGTTFSEKKQELLEKLKLRYQLFVMGNLDFDILPTEAKFKLLKQVKAGAGLVFVYPRKTKLEKLFSHTAPGRTVMLSLVAKLGLPKQAAKQYDGQLLNSFYFGRGRIAVINYKDNHESKYEGLSLTARNSYSRLWWAEYENNLVLVLRAMKWAAGGDSDIQLSCPQLADSPLLDQQAQTIRLKTVNQGRSSGRLELRLRNEYNEVLKTATAEIDGKNNTVEFELPTLLKGQYYLDAVVKVQDYVDNFGYFAFTVKSPVKVQLVTPSESVRYHAPVRAELKLNKVVPNGSVIISLFDLPYQREWYRKVIPLNGQKNISINIADYYLPTIAGYLKCTVVQDGKNILNVEKTVFFPDYRLEEYLQMTWTCVSEKYLAPIYAAQVVDRLGWRAGLERPTPGGRNGRGAALLNQRFVPYVIRIGLKKGKKGEVIQSDWSYLPPAKRNEPAQLGGDQSFVRPEVKQLWADAIRHRVENLPKYGPAIYNLGDENFFSYDAGFGKYDTPAFRIFLKQKYGSIAKLNLEWGSAFADFSVVPHYTQKMAKEQKNFPAWFDHRQYMEKMYADIHHFLAREIKKYDPDAKVGAEGSVPGDLEQTIKGLEYWGPYSNLVMDEVLRSIGGDKIRMLWWGGYVGSHGGRNDYPIPLWKDLLTGNVNGNSWFFSFAGKAQSGIAADMSFPKYMQKLLPFLDELKNGLAQLLIATPLEPQGVAVLWSHASNSAKLLDERFINPANSAGDFIRFCYRNGINFDFLTASMLDKLPNYKVLFLFGISAVDKATAEKISAFVRNGGTVIADMNPGVLNEFLRPMKQNQLAELFGNITLDKLPQPQVRALKLNRDYKRQLIEFSATNVSSTPGIEPFTVRKYGKGDVVLLNFTLSTAINSAVDSRAFDRFMSQLLAATGVETTVTVKGVDRSSPALRLRTRRGDGFMVIGLLADVKDIGQAVTFKLNTKGYIYLPDSGYAGYDDTLTVKLISPFQLMTVFDRQQQPPVIELSHDSVLRGQAVQLKLNSFTPGTVLFVRIKAPDGKQLTLRDQVITVKDNSKPVSLYFAYNDSFGVYNIKVTDVATGLTAEKKITLKK
ncbi:MAG: beta-galactosidase [Victivallaceae bacterium]|nr:beta-galactosidase [Victivallaceae bacterium]